MTPVVAAIAGLSLGTIAQWVTVATVGALAWVLVRGGGGSAVTILQESNRVLEHHGREQGERIAALTAQVAELRERTDVALAIRPLLDWTSHHEQRDQERFEATLEALREVAVSMTAARAA